VPVESQHAPECLEPERVGQASQHLLDTLLGREEDDDLAREAQRKLRDMLTVLERYVE